MESPFQSLVKCYVHGIIRQAQGALNPYEMLQFSECRKAIKRGLQTFEWLLMGFDGHVINVVMQMGERFLGDGNVQMALAFYREASHMFPQAGICYIRETQCHVVLKCFDQAKRACRKAIRHSDDSDFNQLYSIIDMFIENNRLQEAHDLYVILMDRFPHHYQVLQIVQELKGLLIRDKAEESKKEIPNKKKKNASKGPASGIKKTTSKNIGQTSNEKLGEASGGTDPSETVDIAQNAASAKVVKTSKQLKREQMAREKEIKREIKKASKEQEEERKKQEEVEARKRKVREEEEEKLQKQEEVEARKRKEREEHEKKLEKQKNDEIKKQQGGTNKRVGKKSSKTSNGNKAMDTHATRSKNSSTNTVVPKKLSLNDMSTAYDQTLSSGSQLRRVCSTCNTPRAFSYNQRNCHSCRSEFVVWYKRVNTTSWVRPRMPLNQDIAGPYVHCKHFLQSRSCVKTPCKFAHGEDELEIWELCRVKKTRQQAPHSRNEGFKERKTNVSSLQNSRSCMTLNGHDSGTGRRSRTESFSSLHSQSSSNTFDMLSTGDTILDNFDSDSEYSSYFSQDGFDELSQDSAGRSTSSLSLNVDMDASAPKAEAQTTPVEPDQSDDGWIEVGRRKKPQRIVSEELNRENRGKNKKKKKKATSSATTTSSQDFDTTVLLVKEQEKLRCEFCKITFSSMLQLEYHYSDPQHRFNVTKKIQQLNAKSYTKFRPPPDGVYMGRYRSCRRFEQGYCYFGNKCTFAHGDEECTYWKASYQLQAQRLAQFQEKRLLTESFSEIIYRRIKLEGEHHVLKENLPGVTVNCSSPLRVELDGPQKDVPQNHKWIFDVRIQTKYRVLLRQVTFLLETHLDKFKFIRNPTENCSSNMQSIQLLEEDFVENSAKQESAVQFCVQFSSHVFGDFQQKLVFDFGHGSVLARSLYVSVISKDICSSREDSSTRTTYCRILEWSVEKMELILCKDLIGLDLDGLCEQYSIPNDLPAYPAESVEFTRETYCKLWHDILFIEEQHIQMEVARYDIHDGAMKIVNSFKQSVDVTVFARPGELFGEIYLSDYLVMDEVAGHLIDRSVMSVILRPKMDHFQSDRVYECSTKLKTSELVIIKLNEVLCKDYVFVIGQEIYIDVKFRYNRLPMCEMHEAIDMCKEKTKVLLPNVKNVSYTNKKSIHDWFMDRKPNTNQHEAIAMILDPSPTPPILVIGPFGTGKTFTLSLACVSILSQSERNKVLICTHSNSAADIHLQHLDEKIAKKSKLNLQPRRVHNLFRNVQTIPEELRKYCLIEETTNVIKEPSWNEIHDRNVIITTLATARMLWKFYQDGRLRFTHILIDEAAQALEPECLTPLVMADENTKIVLAGDHKQMGPQVYSKCLRDEDVGPKRSLLERLFTHYEQCDKSSSQPSSSLDYKNTFLQIPYLVLLTENYRCHAKILDFPSDCFYGGKLVARGDQSTLELVPVLSFYAAQGVDNRDEGSLAYYNDAEVAEVVKRVEELVQLWPKDWRKRIGVLTPYRDQVKRIREGLRKKGLGYVNVETVENVQGKEFTALFISTVRTMWTCSQIEGRNIDEDPSELDFAFLSDPRFLNTAVTRAKCLLAVVGDPMSLCSVGACRNLWKEYLQRCDANKGLYGCTLKTVMDFCLRSQALDPSAHEFTPNKNVQDEKDETLKTTSSKGGPKVSNEENSIGIEIGSSSKVSETELDNASISHGPSSTAMANQTIQPVSSAVVSGQDPGRIEGIQVDREADLTEDDQRNRNENVSDRDENKDEDDSEMNEAGTDYFFRRDGTDDNFDKIIEELIKACQETRQKDEACQETKKKDEGRQENVTVEDFPSLTDVPPAPSTPHWSNVIINRTFSAGFKDGRIELGFHVKDSERFVRLTGGKLSLKENGDNQSGHDIDAFPQEELLQLLKGSPTLFTKCSFRIDTASRQLRYCGQLPTPDSPDIHIPGRVRRVYEDDVVVLELRPSAIARDEKEQKQEVKIFGYIKGVLRRPIEPEERQFVCTVDRASPGVMIPINKNSPKFMNFTKTDENIIPIYIMKDKEVSRATILSKKHYGEALAGERVFVVKYLKWRPDCPYPLGLAIRHIPHGRDFKTGMEILYEEYNIKREFDTKLRKSIKREFSENWQVPVSEKGRHVYRDNVFTIDPPESLDLDDAISIQSLSNGNYELHIHIADVSYFVLPNTALDEEARLRGTSYYPPKPKETVPMPKETVPMLPRELSEDCCSLLKGKDRLALTLSVEVRPNGTVVGDTRIERSVVRSSSRLTYLQAQKLIDESSLTEVPINGEAKQIPVEEAIGVVHRIAQERRKVRLGFGRSLYERKRDDSDDDDDDENEREAHQMIEEIMVMANHLVAKYLLKKFPNCTPLRVQPPPKTRRVVEWRQRFQKFVDFSLGLEWLGDKEIAQEENIRLKVPFTTWSKIISQVRQNSNFEELVNLVCDLDLFPQLALANVHQQLLQQRGQYMCSGETFENIPFPWLQDDKKTPTDKQKVHADVLSNSLIEIASLAEDNESISEDNTDQETNSGEIETDATDDLPVSSSASANESVQSSADVSNQRELNKILYGHASLCLDAYCHFTSPIRRYIDIIVHRLLVTSIEYRPNFMDSDDITTLCDRSTFFARNSRRFEKTAKKLRLAVNSQSSMRFVSAFIDEVAPDSLKLFFGTGEFELLRGKSVRIARLGPDKDPEEVDDHIKLQWTFRFLRLDEQGRAQPKLHVSDDVESQDLSKKLERQTEDEEPTDSSEVSDDDFDYTVGSEHWNRVLEAVKNQNEDELKSRLQEVDDDVQKQRKPECSTKISLVKRLEINPSLSSNVPCQHPNTGKPESCEKETDDFLKVVKYFKPYDRVKVQICSQMTRGVLSPAIQLFKLTDKIHACIEHRSFPTTCFAKTSYKRPNNTVVSDITEYVKLWKPVLMMEIATSAVREDDVITLSNLRVSLAQDSKGLVTMDINLSHDYIIGHFLGQLDLDLMCVRVKDPDGSGKDTGYWVGHFQISAELRKKEDARKIPEEAEKNAKKDQAVQTDEAGLNSSTPVSELQDTKKTKKKENKNTSAKKEQDDWPTLAGSNLPSPFTGFQNTKNINNETKTRPKKDQFQAVLARLIYSSTPVPESLITQKYCYVTVELIFLSIPDRRCLEALVNSVAAPELVQNICTGQISTKFDVEPERELPKNLSLCNVHHTLQDFYPLNSYQRDAVQKALTKSFTLIQGPPGTGKTVTGVHIAYWFAQLNQKRIPTVEKEGEACKGSMVFYCGPSNKSVDVVARYLMKIPGLKILRIYGQEIERKVFPVPDKVTLFRSKRVAVQLKADEDLKDVSLHHVIRSAECPLAETLKMYDEKFKEYTGYNSNAPRLMIDEFNKVKSEAERWAITQRGVNVILATCTTAYSPRITIARKDFVCQCIIDECGMCIEAETLCAMMGSRPEQVVLIGDHKQLQPVIKCDKAKDLGLGISMFERYSERAQMLEIQYRMHEELCQFPSEFFYDGKLKTARQVRDRRPDNVKWPNGDRYPFVFHHVEGIEESLIVTTDQGNENSKKNQKEIEKVVHVARRLNNEGIKGDDIVILSPYRAQCFEITKKLKQHNLNDISVMSVVAAQGSEKNYVILSLVRSVPEREIERNPSRSWLMEHLGFLTDEHQINVALTRAKRGLCIVGNANLLGICSMWRELLKHYESKGCLKMDA